MSHPGPWSLPPDVEAQADSYGAIGYTGAGPWRGEGGCSGGFTQGGQVLKDWVLANWPQVSNVGGYACRPIVGNSSAMSVHATGRAIDIHIPLDGNEADNDLGDPLANYLVEHADEMGIQMVIWDRWLWSTSREPYSRYYGGEHPHHDHLHVELTPEAARMETPWFQNGTPAPEVEDCEALPTDGGTIDETDACFVAFGPSQYWRRVDGEGMGGSLLWTNAFQSSSPSNWARWNVNLEAGGEYVVEYYKTSDYAVYSSARYEIRAAGSDQEVTLDQSAGSSGWNEIGTFQFEAGGGQWISIFDNADFDVGSDQHINVDAIRLRPAGQEPPDDDPVDDTEPTPGPDTDTDGDDDSGTNTTIGPAGTDDRYGTTEPDASLPPKGSQEPPPDTHDDHHSAVEAGDYPLKNYAGGRACSTAPTAPAGSGLLVFLAGLALLVRRRR